MHACVVTCILLITHCCTHHQGAINCSHANPSPLVQIPTKAQADSVSQELRRRAELPEYVKRVLEALPPGTHPMTQFATGILALQVGGWAAWCPALHAAFCMPNVSGAMRTPAATLID